MAMRHSSGWSTLISISFFMRCVSGTVADWSAWVFVRSSGRIRGGGWRPRPSRRSSRARVSHVELHVDAGQEGALIEQVGQREGFEQLLGTSRALGGDVQAEAEDAVLG